LIFSSQDLDGWPIYGGSFVICSGQETVFRILKVGDFAELWSSRFVLENKSTSIEVLLLWNYHF
jgi:hypothetical protein